MKTTIFLLLLAVASSAFAEENSKGKPAERIVSLAPHITEMLFEIGAGEKVVATVDYANHPEAAKAIPRIGGHYGINIEKLLLLKPDLVLFWQGGNKAQDLAKMQQLGLNVVLNEPVYLEYVAKELVKLGKLTGNEQQAQQKADAFLTNLNVIKSRYASKNTLSTFYQLWSTPLMTINKDSWINQLVSACNARNIFSESPTKTPQVSIENVLVAKPDIIVIPDANSTSPQPSVGWESWPQIPAVTKQQIIHVNGDVMHRFSPKMLSGLADMCHQIDAFR